MTIDQIEQLKSVGARFQVEGEFVDAYQVKVGHINRTFAATYRNHQGERRYIHQTINQSVFRDPVTVMNNVVRVTQHLRQRLEAANATDLDRRALQVIPARDGLPYHVDEQRQYWRTFAFVEGIRTFEAVESPAQAYQAGLAFGSFQDLLSDLPARELAPTIPDFHHTRKRFDRLQQAIRDAAPARRSNATAEITFATAQEPVVDVLLDAQARGLLHERVTHNDTKFNNVMLDVETGHGMCVVDLDTVMPGLVLYDFGDMVRTTTSPTREDETDLSKVALDLATFRELARGYLEATRSFLTPAERSFLVFAGKLITYTIGIRFLTDFLEGDHYFRIQRPRHNLERARNQFKLMESIRRQEAPMQRVIDDLG